MKPLRALLIVLPYLGYLLIITLHPFELARDVTDILGQFLRGFLTPPPHGIALFGRRDFIENVLLFIPLGVLLHRSLTSPPRSRAATILGVSLCGGFLSFLVELSQAFFVDRHPAASDVLANTVGAACGALLAEFIPLQRLKGTYRVWDTVARSKVPFGLALMWGTVPYLFFIAQFPWFNFRNWDPRFTFQIGSEATRDRSWLGTIYLTAIYQRALSAAEIAQHFHLGFTAEALTRRAREGLVAFYAFDEGSGHTVHDTAAFGPPLDLTFSPAGHVRWLQDANGIEILKPSIISSQGPAQKLYTALRATNALSIEAWINPASARQSGPARIAAFSRDKNNSNFSLGQHGADMVFGVRTPLSARFGSRVSLLTKDGFLTPGLFHLVATYVEGRERLYVNGRQHPDELDLTTDAIIGFGFAATKNPIAQMAYSFFYFYPLSFLLSAFLSIQGKGLRAALLLPVAVATSLLSTAEILQALAFGRALDLPLMGYGAAVGMVGAGSGAVFTKV
jgi:VanZ family protein